MKVSPAKRLDEIQEAVSMEWLTATQIYAKVGMWSLKHIAKLLHELHNNKRIERKIEQIDGHHHMLVAYYRLAPATIAVE